ncbi:hypothetical protein F2Q68_00043040 [Brassica cretica]|nr:hypothetical protein F2Q68_00010430 [Brassica cretica]KAF2607138.1 hypothetical protein F2Q68_00043040 [Brassica cretica]KAF3548754.1 hypothetical protein DY000_02006905 [Brassica cretica]
MAGNVKWVRYDLREIASKGRRECMDNCRIDVSEELGRYVATELRLELGRYVATLFELMSDVSCFLRKAFRKEESILKKYLSKKVFRFLLRGFGR